MSFVQYFDRQDISQSILRTHKRKKEKGTDTTAQALTYLSVCISNDNRNNKYITLFYDSHNFDRSRKRNTRRNKVNT